MPIEGNNLPPPASTIPPTYLQLFHSMMQEITLNLNVDYVEPGEIILDAPKK